jgi:hypothetical protein
MPHDGDPDHPIIERPWEYAIRSLCYHNDPEGWHTSHLDLTLVRGDTIRRLRFLAPQGFAVEKGCFPQPTGGMCILDVRHRQLEDIGVRVADIEATRGAVTFWAREVIDLGDDAGTA